jgi:LysM repeat protein/phage FluMu protein Com
MRKITVLSLVLVAALLSLDSAHAGLWDWGKSLVGFGEATPQETESIKISEVEAAKAALNRDCPSGGHARRNCLKQQKKARETLIRLGADPDLVDSNPEAAGAAALENAEAERREAEESLRAASKKSAIAEAKATLEKKCPTGGHAGRNCRNSKKKAREILTQYGVDSAQVEQEIQATRQAALEAAEKARAEAANRQRLERKNAAIADAKAALNKKCPRGGHAGRNCRNRKKKARETLTQYGVDAAQVEQEILATRQAALEAAEKARAEAEKQQRLEAKNTAIAEAKAILEKKCPTGGHAGRNCRNRKKKARKILAELGVAEESQAPASIPTPAPAPETPAPQVRVSTPGTSTDCDEESGALGSIGSQRDCGESTSSEAQQTITLPEVVESEAGSTPETATDTPQPGKYYRIQSGDTLGKIAYRLKKVAHSKINTWSVVEVIQNLGYNHKYNGFLNPGDIWLMPQVFDKMLQISRASDPMGGLRPELQPGAYYIIQPGDTASELIQAWKTASGSAVPSEDLEFYMRFRNGTDYRIADAQGTANGPLRAGGEIYFPTVDELAKFLAKQRGGASAEVVPEATPVPVPTVKPPVQKPVTKPVVPKPKPVMEESGRDPLCDQGYVCDRWGAVVTSGSGEPVRDGSHGCEEWEFDCEE